MTTRSKSLLRREAIQQGKEMPTGFVTMEEHNEAITKLEQTIEWLEFIFVLQDKEVINLDKINGHIIVNDDPNNWKDESIKITCHYTPNGIPLYSSDLKKVLEHYKEIRDKGEWPSNNHPV